MTLPSATASDLVEIQSVLVRQKLMVDDRDEDRLRACYTSDITLSVSFNGSAPTVTTGRDAVVADVVAAWKRAESDDRPQLVHFVGPAEITHLTPDRARARSMCLYVQASSGTVAGWGDYTDEMARVDGSWRLAARTLVATFVSPG